VASSTALPPPAFVAEQHIRGGNYAIRWTQLSCRRFRDNEVRFQLHALAYNLAVFLAHVGLP
jgi:hypothetical protein